MDDREAWHEIARPQVHGHDINCVAIIRGKGNHRYISGAEEKVARVFEAPLSFLKTLNYSRSLKSAPVDELPATVQILGANMSALGLSQKPIYVQGKLLLQIKHVTSLTWKLNIESNRALRGLNVYHPF